MSVLLPDPLDPTSAVVEPAGAWNVTCLQHGHAGVVLERHVVEFDLAANVRHRGARRILVRLRVAISTDLANAIQPGERFRHLRADVTPAE